MSGTSSLSVIIPTWNEAPLIADAIRCAGRIGEEVIVVDGGSRDDTVERAQEAGARTITAPKGRGPQLHAGALAASGDILLFLHADARLPAAAKNAVLGALSDRRVVGGNFLIRFLPESWFTRCLVPSNDLRRRLTKRFYGDSGIFIRSKIYRDLGGFAPVPLMEDYEFSARMERAGRCVYIRETSVYASARRFRRREIRTLLLWMTLQSLCWLRVPPRVLAKAYPDLRGDHPEQFIAAWARIEQSD
jgi:rSAM/selenodomain-associated transferase 2